MISPPSRSTFRRVLFGKAMERERTPAHAQSLPQPCPEPEGQQHPIELLGEFAREIRLAQHFTKGVSSGSAWDQHRDLGLALAALRRACAAGEKLIVSMEDN